MNTCGLPHTIDEVSWWVITCAGLVDAINPCAIAVLLILLGGLMVFKEQGRRRVLASGLSFISALYLAYLFLGLGLISLLQFSGLATVFHRLIGGLAIVIGLLNIKDFIWYGGGGFVMEIPRRWRPTMQKLLLKVSSPSGAFLTGLLVTLFELPCTGGPYLFVLGLLSHSLSKIEIIPLLLYYNLVFVSPLIFLTLGVYFGYASVERAIDWKERNLRLLHLIAGVLMLGLGVWVFVS
jgi:cytochrome c biogenesis protein CcdA